MSNVTNFLNLMFDEAQVTCFSQTAKGIRVYSYLPRASEFFCINALHPKHDLCPEKEWHNVNKPRRADGNVVCFRNFLIEIDSMSLENQIEYVTERLPLEMISAITYSGGKSYHFIISLEEPLKNIGRYIKVAKRLSALLPKADPSCKNPSRLSRLPGVIRQDSNKMQKLVHLGSRVNTDELLSLLPDIHIFQPYPTNDYKGRGKRMLLSHISKAVNNPDDYIEQHGGRNNFFFWLGNRLEDSNRNEEEQLFLIRRAYDKLDDTTGFSFDEALQAARRS